MRRTLFLTNCFWILPASAILLLDYLSSGILFEPIYWILLIGQIGLIGYFGYRTLFLVAIIGFVMWVVFFIGIIIPYDPNFWYGTHFQEFVHTKKNAVTVMSSLGLAANIYWLSILLFVRRSDLNNSMANVNKEQLFSSNINTNAYVFWLLLFGIIVVIVTAEGWVLFAPYPENKELWGFLDSGGVAILAPLCFIGAYFLVGQFQVKTIIRLITYIALVIAAIHYLLAGDRGTFLTIYVGVLTIYWLAQSRRSQVKALFLIMLCIFMVYFLIHWGNVRVYAYEEGLIHAIFQIYPSRYSGDFSVADITLIPASFGHYLHAVDLYNQGVRLQGETFVALVPQSIPSFVANWIDYERPLNSAWRLAEYRINGGGMYIFAEAFWNFGFIGPIILSLSLAIMAIAIERFYSRRRNVAKFLYFGFVSTFSFTAFYGMLPMTRSIQIMLIAMFVLVFNEKLKRKRWGRAHAHGMLRTN
jgi:hypothetical protein